MESKNLTFLEYKYERPELDLLKNEIAESLMVLTKAENVEQAIKAIDKVNELRGHFDTMMNICYIRNTINTVDEYYEEEKAWFDEFSPIFESEVQKFLKAIISSKFIEQLKANYGKQWLDLIEVSLKTFDDSIIEDLQIENKLVTKYEKLKASAKINFNGQVLNLAQIGVYLNHSDRKTRKEAEIAQGEFYKAHEEEFDDIYDQLVLVRDKMAKKLGYDNFVKLGYLRLKRTDYTEKEVGNYRKQVLDDLVDFVCKLQAKKADRLGIKDLKSYDLGISFLSGNPLPKGDKDWMVDKAQKMYAEMSSETKEFFDFMVEHQLLDLETKPNKAMGGYCTVIFDYQSPFIFSNFNSTADDVGVLTHEAGHAFQVYETMKKHKLLDYMFPTNEACEIHSMSMEFFTWPWMKLFFEKDTDKYYCQHLEESISFIPYGVTVDEFQHEIYANPKLSKSERKTLWRKIEKKYMPYKVYENAFFDSGTFWYKQGHIFEVPFYYIDYTLAQVCAHQFLIKDQINHQQSWNDYLALCREGGSQSFLDLLKVGNLKNPFVDGTIKYIVSKLTEILDEIETENVK